MNLMLFFLKKIVFSFDIDRDLVEDLGIQSDSPRATLYLYPNNFLIDTITASDFERVYSDELERCIVVLSLLN